MYVCTFVIEKFKYSKKLQIFLNTLHILKYLYVLFVIVIGLYSQWTLYI